MILAATIQDPEIKAVRVADDAIQPQVAVDADGGIYVVFIRAGNIQVSISTDRGRSFSAPVTAIDGKGNARGGMQRGPRIAVDADKNVYATAPICFDEEEMRQRYPKPELWLAISKDGGKTFGDRVRVNEVEKQAPEALHSIAAAPNGDLHVAWIDGRTGKPAVFYKVYTERGARAGKDLRLAEPVCECCAPCVSVDHAGNPLVAFREGGQKPSREIFAMRSTNKGKSFQPPVQVNRAATKLPT
jgi:hypothetical protein